jgi:hypothetical protein
MLDLPTSEIGNNNALQVALQVAGGRAEEGKGGTRSGADRRHYLPPVKTNHGRFSLGTLWELWEHQRKEFFNPFGDIQKINIF